MVSKFSEGGVHLSDSSQIVIYMSIMIMMRRNCFPIREHGHHKITGALVGCLRHCGVLERTKVTLYKLKSCQYQCDVCRLRCHPLFTNFSLSTRIRLDMADFDNKNVDNVEIGIVGGGSMGQVSFKDQRDIVPDAAQRE